MIVVDSSALFAILANEPDAEQFANAIDGATACRISAFNAFELNVSVARGFGWPHVSRVDLLLKRGAIEVVPFDAEARTEASAAYRRFGKGYHAARLNLADCAAYALAARLNVPLLYKGSDFIRTDVMPALDF